MVSSEFFVWTDSRVDHLLAIHVHEVESVEEPEELQARLEAVVPTCSVDVPSCVWWTYTGGAPWQPSRKAAYRFAGLLVNALVAYLDWASYEDDQCLESCAHLLDQLVRGAKIDRQAEWDGRVTI